MPRFRLEGPRRCTILFCPHTLCMSYVTNTFLLVSSSVQSKQLLCVVHCQGPKRNNNLQRWTFVGFHNHSPLWTMLKSTSQNTFLIPKFVIDGDGLLIRLISSCTSCRTIQGVIETTSRLVLCAPICHVIGTRSRGCPITGVRFELFVIVYL